LADLFSHDRSRLRVNPISATKSNRNQKQAVFGYERRSVVYAETSGHPKSREKETSRSLIRARKELRALRWIRVTACRDLCKNEPPHETRERFTDVRIEGTYGNFVGCVLSSYLFHIPKPQILSRTFAPISDALLSESHGTEDKMGS